MIAPAVLAAQLMRADAALHAHIRAGVALEQQWIVLRLSDQPVLAAVNSVESDFGRVRQSSVAGPQGLMQFIPSTWATYGRGDVHVFSTQPAGRWTSVWHFIATTLPRPMSMRLSAMQAESAAIPGFSRVLRKAPDRPDAAGLPTINALVIHNRARRARPALTL